MKALESVEYLVIHHSASPRDTTTVDMIREWHLARGWSDIGYHFCITGDGKLHMGRALTKQGAHAPKVNALSWGVCLTGDNTKPKEQWVRAQEDTLLELIDCIKFLIPKIKIIGHRDTGQATECPGLDIQTWLIGVL